MDGVPGASGPDRGGGSARAPAQSNLLGVVLLFGLVAVGALAILVAGVVMVQDVQQSSTESVTRDVAGETHHALRQVTASGDRRRLPGAGVSAVDVRAVDSGSVRIEMVDGETGSVCGHRVESSLGAVVHDSGEYQAIYEGGGIWLRTDSGLTISRYPEVGYDGSTSRIGIRAVSTARSGGVAGAVASSNRSRSRAVARASDEMLRTCPRTGHGALRVAVTSTYADAWEQTFDRRLGREDDVRVTRNGSTVRALIANATDARGHGGLGITAVSPVDATITPSESLEVDVEVTNRGADAASGTVELRLDGAPVATTADVRVDGDGATTTTLTVPNQEINRNYHRGTVVDYDVVLRDEAGELRGGVPGAFVYAEQVASLELADVSHDLDASDATLDVTATVRNLGARTGTTDASVEFVDPAIGTGPAEVTDVPVAGGNRTEITFPVDVAGLPVGTHEYRVTAAGETVTRRVTVSESPTGGVAADGLRVESIDPVDSEVAPEEGFAVDVALENVGGGLANGTAHLDVAGLEAVTEPAELAPGETDTVRLAVPGSALEELATGRLHDYDVRVTAGGESVDASGTVYVGESGAALSVAGANHTIDDGSEAGGEPGPGSDTLTVAATVSNDGTAAEAAPVEFALLDAESGERVATEETAPVELPAGGSTEVTVALSADELSGDYEYELSYGDDVAHGTLSLEGVTEGDGSVTTSVAGEGTVTVLGTEVSAERPTYGYGAGATWAKYWTPVGVSVRAERGGETTVHEFRNEQTAADVHDERNLNTYDTQNGTYEWTWEQTGGENVSVQIGATLWDRTGLRQYDPVNVRRDDGPGHEPRWYRDYHPPTNVWSEPALRVDASAGDNPDNVRVLTDGDRVPEVRRGYDDQRNVSEVLNQGAADRIDPETGELELGPNEAVFLFEVTDGSTYEEGIWTAATEREDAGDPNFNDVVVLVEFDAAEALSDVEFSVDDGGDGLTVSLPAPERGDDDPSVSVDAPTVEGGPADEAVDPDPPGSDVGGPVDPESVEVDVEHVTIE